MERFEFRGEQGPTQDFKRIHELADNIQESAHKIAAVVVSSKRVIETLGKSDRFKLTQGQLDILKTEVAHELTAVTQPASLDEVRAKASKAVNKGLAMLGIEKPGFANAFGDALKDDMTLH